MDDTQRDASDAVPSEVRQVDDAPGLVPVPVETSASKASNGGGASHIEDRVIERARETAVRLKPVAIAAEEMTAKALDLSAKGLAKAAAYLEQMDASGVWKKPVVTRIEAYKAFYPAEAHHQDFMAKNPKNAYIFAWDKPKVGALARLFPGFYRASFKRG